ncbi:hypothetical protein THERMOT_1279 [Bathymodiolus thermophilus thioautotrophic gill symbiont]|nr:hypothetical protein THERMOT_1279 [Bathymodiolus thermophilus thioautotrophic gill symbiont]
MISIGGQKLNIAHHLYLCKGLAIFDRKLYNAVLNRKLHKKALCKHILYFLNENTLPPKSY